MRANIVIANKLPKKDSTSGLDVWYKTRLQNVKYKKNKVTTVSDKDVSMGQTFTILIPFSTKYKPYKEWKNNPEGHYTMSQGDYIFFDDIQDAITPNNIQKLRQSNECCEVRMVEEAEEKYGVKVQLRVSGV